MNITITGDIGAGKSTVVSLLEKKGYERYYAGKYYRGLAEQLGISVTDVHNLAETDPSIDATIDEATSAYCKDKDKIVVDARLGWHFVKDALHVYLACPTSVAAKRIVNSRRNAESYSSMEEAEAAIEERRGLEVERFDAKYHLNSRLKTNYNLYIDTSLITAEEVVDIILYYAGMSKSDFKRTICINC